MMTKKILCLCLCVPFVGFNVPLSKGTKSMFMEGVAETNQISLARTVELEFEYVSPGRKLIQEAEALAQEKERLRIEEEERLAELERQRLEEERRVEEERVRRENTMPYYNPYNLMELSGATHTQIYNMLEGSGLQSLTDQYAKIEENYGFNVLFIMALNSEESGHGRSSLAVNNNNIGGVKDGNGGWRYFDSWIDSLHSIATLIRNQYLHETGSYFNGYSIWDVNVKYCEGTTWSSNLNEIVGDLQRKYLGN